MKRVEEKKIFRSNSKFSIHQISRITKKNPKHRNYKNIYQIFYRFDFRRVRKNFKQGRHLRFVGSRSSIIIFTAIPLPLLGQLLLSPRNVKTGCPSRDGKRAKADTAMKITEREFRLLSLLLLLPLFSTVSGTQKTGQVSVESFFFSYSRPARSDRFLFSSANFPPRVSATLVNAGRLEDDT